MRHIVLEGPDGAGKTRLREVLLSRYPDMIQGERASTSLRGPVRNLAQWVGNQFRVMDASNYPIVYDRHPIISEPIYGVISRGRVEPGFGPSPWLSSNRLDMYARTFVIWCLPPLSQCEAAVDPSRDMPGVAENIGSLHAAYLKERKLWGGPSTRYDLTKGDMSVLPNGQFAGAVQFVDSIQHLIKEQVYGPRKTPRFA